MISDDQITQYQVIYKNHFGKEISREDALKQGTRLLQLVELVFKTMNEKEYQELRDRRNK